MNELTITVSGWVATDTRHIQGKGDLAVTSFRLASTPRYFDRERNTWVDGTTEWFTVRTFRGPAITVHASIKKGQPVVVTGRLRTTTWQAQDGPRWDMVIDATAVGQDCTRGTATFSRATGDPSLSEADMDGATAARAEARDAAAMAHADGAAPPPEADPDGPDDPYDIDDDAYGTVDEDMVETTPVR